MKKNKLKFILDLLPMIVFIIIAINFIHRNDVTLIGKNSPDQLQVILLIMAIATVPFISYRMFAWLLDKNKARQGSSQSNEIRIGIKLAALCLIFFFAISVLLKCLMLGLLNVSTMVSAFQAVFLLMCFLEWVVILPALSAAWNLKRTQVMFGVVIVAIIIFLLSFGSWSMVKWG